MLAQKDAMSFERRFHEALSSAIEKTPELEKIPSSNSTAPQIVNLVSTVHLLPQEKAPGSKKQLYRLPLESIAMKMRTCSQFAPRQFAANILRLTDSITDTTSLIFRSGKIVTVRGLSINHTRYISQLFRIIIERVETMMRDPESGEVRPGTLEGRTIFAAPRVHNVVGSGFLGIRVDLPKLREAAPHCCQYEPEIFPGLMFRVWITKTQRCECSMAINHEPAVAQDEEEQAAEQIIDLKAKCVCVVKCLIFDSGELVITGGRDVDVVYEVFYSIQRLVGLFEDTEDKDVPRENRFNHRLARLMIKMEESEADDGSSDTRTKKGGGGGGGGRQRKRKTRAKVKQVSLTEDQAVAAVMVGLRDVKPNHKLKRSKKRAKSARDPTVTPLMKLAAAGRVKQMETLLAMDPDQLDAKDGAGNTALDRMMNVPVSERKPQHTTVIGILKEHADKRRTE